MKKKQLLDFLKHINILHSVWEENFGVGWGYARGEGEGDFGVCEGDDGVGFVMKII